MNPSMESASPVSAYEIASSDLAYAREFARNPIGHQSPGLRKVLNKLRGERPEGKYVLICVQPHKEWVLGQMNGPRKPVTIYPDVRFSTFEDGEREIFRRRWKDYTGADLTW